MKNLLEKFWKSSYCADCIDKGLIVLRLALAIVFIIHGIGKLFGIGPYPIGIVGTTVFFTGVGLPFPMFFAFLVALVETFGGIFILVGFMTRLSAFVLAINMLVATLIVHF